MGKKIDIKNRKSESNVLVYIFIAAVLSRFLLLLGGILMMRIFGINNNVTEYLATASDAEWYRRIAENGYTASGEYSNSIVFYPLFPYLMKLLYILFRNYTAAGLFISYTSFGIASVYLYKLMRIDYSKEKAADALLLLFIAPYGMFFLSAHTESLFLMLSVMSLYYIRRGNWLGASITGFFAALSKTQGVLLFVPLAYEWAVSAVNNKKADKKGLWGLMIPAGMAVYLCINKALQGDFFAFTKHQAAAPWYNSAAWVSEGLSTSYQTGINNFSLSLILYFPQIILFFAVIAGLLFGLKKKVRTSYLAFLGVYMLVTYLQGWMLSGARYVTSCIPIYVIMAAADNKFAKYIMYLLSGGLCLYYMFIWLQGYAIM